MSHITTHVLDSSRGLTAAGMPVQLSGPDGLIASSVTNADGRVTSLGPEQLPPGSYTLAFDTAKYFAETPAFYPRVSIEFRVSGDEHYHVPLLLSPFGYSTYRGS